ncbi:inositol 2-dehydrogenase-like protein [Leptotrombidium deliense]|uniref:Inositol 2-dehydrogenase-like protein n=1 Tax=Leptotrombidium deliense TaxID=299467 RepID=A0A443SJF8_9ACAR|nr:inositol 2-dehydrogenase-like protein [Leptotrombidium deliense]
MADSQPAVINFDLKIKKYFNDLKGSKLLPKRLVHENDVGLEFLRKVEKNGNKVYDDNKVIGVAIIGLGRIGFIHLEKLLSHRNVNILYCVEADKRKANFVECRYNLASVRFLTPDEEHVIYEDPNVDAVFVCTPTEMHEKSVIKALEAKKAVFCEKPLATCYEGMKKCYSLAKKHNLPIFCAFNRRFDPSFRQIKERVASGEIGKIHVIKTCSRDSPLPSMDYIKTSGGIFHDCGVHDIDLVCWILNEFPISVCTQAHSFIPEIAALNDFDTVSITMKFPSGAIAIIDLSRLAVYGYDQRLEVFGSNGMLCSNGVTPTAVVHHSGTGATNVPICYSFASRYSEAYNLEVEHFIDCVQNEKETEIKDYQTLAVKKIATYCEESARKHTFIDIPKHAFEAEL